MEYQVEQTYEFNVQGLKEGPDGQMYIYLDDGVIYTYRVKPYDFQLEPNYQLPNKMVCDVYGMNIHDLPLLRQNKESLLEELYQRNYDVFPRTDYSILKIARDGDASYLLIQDQYGIPHRYYTKSAQEYEVGGSIELCVKGIIKRNGKVYLEFIEPHERKRFKIEELKPYTAPTIPTIQNTGFGIEDLHTEFKSSIVYTASSSTPDIDKQMSIIMKEIAAFMNAEGGRMYIGVNDDGITITGIENDYEHLQDSEYDQYSYDVTGKTEQQKRDVYENKIRNSIRHISSFAGSLVDITFQTIQGHTICILDIKPSPKPMFVNGLLYQRQGASCRLLQRDDISYFVLSKLQGDAITKFLGSYGNDVDVPEEDEDVIVEKASDGNTIVSIPALSAEEDDRDHGVWKHLCFYSDGGFAEKGVTYPGMGNLVQSVTIEKYQKKEHQVLLMQYDNGCLNAADYLKTSFPQRGWSKNGSFLAKNNSVKFVKVWSADIHDFVAVYCEKDGETYVRVVNVMDVGVHDNLHAQGNQMAPEGYTVSGIYHIPAAYHPYIVQLIMKRGAGYAVDGNKKQKSIQRLNEIIRQLAVMNQ